MNFYPRHFNEIGYFSMKNQFHGKFNWLEYICLLSRQYFEDTCSSEFHTSIAMQRAQPWNMPMVAQLRPLERSQSQHRTSQPLSSGRDLPWCPTWAAEPWPHAAPRIRPFCTRLLPYTASPLLVLSTWMQMDLYSPSLPMSLLCFTLKADLERTTKKSFLAWPFCAAQPPSPATKELLGDGPAHAHPFVPITTGFRGGEWELWTNLESSP